DKPKSEPLKNESFEHQENRPHHQRRDNHHDHHSRTHRRDKHPHAHAVKPKHQEKKENPIWQTVQDLHQQKRQHKQEKISQVVDDLLNHGPGEQALENPKQPAQEPVPAPIAPQTLAPPVPKPPRVIIQPGHAHKLDQN
ncbi:MAG: hypothetical protein KGJ93_05390, partial [Patescibacteria group bacterium]|nr:hypothetical protein [Patescibacteria group bacterium]